MTETQAIIHRNLQHFAQVTQSGNLALKNGVCALFNGEREAVIIEVPENSDTVIFHCEIANVMHHPVGQDFYQKILLLNFEVSIMKGCWLAIDAQDLRLVTTQEIRLLTETDFCNLVIGFIEQVTVIRQLVDEIRASH